MRRFRSWPPVLQGVRRWSQRAWQWLQEEKRVVHMVVVAKMARMAGKRRSWRKDDKVDGCWCTWMTEDLVDEVDGVAMVR